MTWKSERVFGAEALEESVRQTVAIIQRVEGFELFPHLWRLLAEGQPLPLDRLAAASGWPVERVRQALSVHPSVEWDNQGRLVGFGLTLRPTPHKFIFEGRNVYGWCASDALMFPVLLGKSGIVESVCPATGKRIQVEVTPKGVRSVDPPEAVVSKVRPDRHVGDVRVEICNLGHFFRSRDASAAWLEAYPEGTLSTVEEDFEIHRRVMEQMSWRQR